MAPVVVGKCFLLVSRLNGHVLGLSPEAEGPDSVDAQVVTCVKNESATQVWYEDKSTGTIRLRDSGLCLTVGDDNTLRVRRLENGNGGQLWSFKDGTIKSTGDPDKVLDISGSKPDPGASVCAWNFHGGANQLWDQVFVNPKFFYLKSQLNGKVLDVEGQCPDPGTKLCMWDQKPEESAVNQLWYLDPHGVIRSCLNDFTIDCDESQDASMQPSDSSRAGVQSWILHDGYVAMKSKLTKVLDIVSQNTENGARLCVWDAHGGTNQKWNVQYV